MPVLKKNLSQSEQKVGAPGIPPQPMTLGKT